MIEKRIQKLTRECFDPKVYAIHIEKWHKQQNKQGDQKEDDAKEKKEQENEDANGNDTKEKKETTSTDKEQNTKETKPIDENTNTNAKTKTKKKSSKRKKKKKIKKKHRNKSEMIMDEYPDLNQLDDFTKYALIMFHSMLSSLDLNKHIVALSDDREENVDNSEQSHKIISTYISTLHDIFASLTTLEIRSGLKPKDTSSNNRSFGVLCNIKDFVLKCIKARHSQTINFANNQNAEIWQKLYELLIKISIGDTNVSSLLQSIWYLLPLIDQNKKQIIHFNLKPTMKYIANMRVNVNGNNLLSQRQHRYASMRESKVHGFGKSSEGRIGCKIIPSEQFVIEPRNIATLNGKNICKLTAFSSHTLALTNDGRVYSWGSGKSLQLGYPNNASQIQTEPKLIASLIDLKVKVIDISCGMAHSLIVSDVGYVYTFGNGTSGRLGHGDQGEKTSPTLIKSLAMSNKFIVSGACGSTFNILIDDQGKMYSFGKNNVGQCGLNHANAVVLSPTLIPFDGDKRVVAIAAGWEHSLCATLDGDIYSWGYGYEGTRAVLGHGDKGMRLKPTRIEALKDVHVICVCCGYDHSLCSTADGKLYTFGLTPVLLEMTKYGKKSGSNIVDIAAGEAHSLCLDEDGLCYTWAHKVSTHQSGIKQLNKNYFGTMPVQAIAAGDKFSFFITAKMDKKVAKKNKNLLNSNAKDNETDSDKHALDELRSEFVTKLNQFSLSDENQNDMKAIQIISYMVSVIDRSCQSIIPSSDQFWESDNAKNANSDGGIKRTEPFTFELSRNTFVLLNDLLNFTMKKIQKHLRTKSEIPMISKLNAQTNDAEWDGWLWWFAASILRIFKSHFHVLATNAHKKENTANKEQDEKKQASIKIKAKTNSVKHQTALLKLLQADASNIKSVENKKAAKNDYFMFDGDNEADVKLLDDIHNSILNILHGHSFKDIKMDEIDNKNRLRLLDIRRESGEVLICGLHVFHKNPNDRLTLLKSILVEDNDKNKTLVQDDAILPFGRSLKEGLLQVFAQQIASQKMTAFTSNELDDWLIVLDSVMQTIHSHMNKASQNILTRKDRSVIEKHEQKKDDEEESKPVEKVKCDLVLCKCGGPLILTPLKDCYTGSGVNCDFCGQSVKDNEVWHCPKPKEFIEHKGGFDLCQKCIKHPMISPKFLEKDDEKDKEKEDDAKFDNEGEHKLSFEGEDINQKCPPRHPLIAAFQSALSSSILSKETQHIEAMEKYTNILLKHSENIISDLYNKYLAIEQNILQDENLSTRQKMIECQVIRFEMETLIEKSLLGSGGLWWWLHILHILAIYPFFTQQTFDSSLKILELLYKIRSKPKKYYIQQDGISFLDQLPFEKVCNLLTSLCVHLIYYQWWKFYDVFLPNNEDKEKEKDTIIKIRNGDNRINAMQKILTLIGLNHSAQSYLILLNATRSTASLATILHERHYLEVRCCIFISNFLRCPPF